MTRLKFLFLGKSIRLGISRVVIFPCHDSCAVVLTYDKHGSFLVSKLVTIQCIEFMHAYVDNCGYTCVTWCTVFLETQKWEMSDYPRLSIFNAYCTQRRRSVLVRQRSLQALWRIWEWISHHILLGFQWVFHGCSWSLWERFFRKLRIFLCHVYWRFLMDFLDLYDSKKIRTWDFPGNHVWQGRIFHTFPYFQCWSNLIHKLLDDCS